MYYASHTGFISCASLSPQGYNVPGYGRWRLLSSPGGKRRYVSQAWSPRTDTTVTSSTIEPYSGFPITRLCIHRTPRRASRRPILQGRISSPTATTSPLTGDMMSDVALVDSTVPQSSSWVMVSPTSATSKNTIEPRCAPLCICRHAGSPFSPSSLFNGCVRDFIISTNDIFVKSIGL